MKELDGPTIYLESFELTKTLYVSTKNFPKPARFVLGARIEGIVTDFLLDLCLVVGKYSVRPKTPEKRMAILLKLSRLLDQMRVLLRLSAETKALSLGHYQSILLKVDSIGRQLGGMIRVCGDQEC